MPLKIFPAGDVRQISFPVAAVSAAGAEIRTGGFAGVVGNWTADWVLSCEGVGAGAIFPAVRSSAAGVDEDGALAGVTEAAGAFFAYAGFSCFSQFKTEMLFLISLFNLLSVDEESFAKSAAALGALNAICF